MTGTEVLTGRVQDCNGPWLADRLLELGVELRHVMLCGDRAADIEAQLRFLADQDVDLLITTGGLGPTADDLTVQIVARFCERELVLDNALEARIDGIVTGLMKRRSGGRTVEIAAVRAANRKQALVPAGACILDPVGTAPGLVIPGAPTVVVLPGPPRELQPMWAAALATEAVQTAIAGRTQFRQQTVRMFGLPESALADTLRDAQATVQGFERLEITTCLRRGELEIVMPEFTGSSNFAVHAVYPCREFLPAKVHAFIDFLTELYGSDPYWNKGLKIPEGNKGPSGSKKKKATTRPAPNSKMSAAANEFHGMI